MSTTLIRLVCPACSKRLKLLPSDRHEGYIVCPRCQHSFPYVQPAKPTDSQRHAPDELPRARPLLVLATALLTAGLLIAGATLGLTWILAPAHLPSAESTQEVPLPDPTPESTPGAATPELPRRPPEPPWLPLDKQKQVQAAIARGKNFVIAQQRSDGTFADEFDLGMTALPGLTLLECGVPARDAVIQKAAQRVRTQARNFTGRAETYELSLALLFLDRLGERSDRPLIRSLALRLVAGQQRDGGWTYHCPPLSESDSPRLLDFLTRTREPTVQLAGLEPKADKPRANPENAEIRRAYDDLPARVREVPSVRAALSETPARLQPGSSDNSNTQFAILALWAARRHQVPLERTLRLVAQRFRQSQASDGSWGYHMQGGHESPAMIGVGLLGLAVGHGLTQIEAGTVPRRDPDIDRALVALSRHLGETSGPLNLYFLWTVERVGVLYKLRQINGKEWYAWGADELLTRQLGKGSWRQGVYYGSTELIDTCFALLFLSRANLTSDLSDTLELLIRTR